MQARYQVELSPVRGTAIFLVVLAALILAAAAGYLVRGAGLPSQHSTSGVTLTQRGPQHDDSWVAGGQLPPHDQSWEGVSGT